MTESAGRTSASNPAAETSITGLSDEFFEAVRAYAKSKKESMRAVYDEAILAMVERIKGGEEVIFPAVVTGRERKSRHIRMSQVTKNGLIDLSGMLKIHKSVIVHKAIRDYLESNGIAMPP